MDYQPATEEDFEILLGIRIAAMRESLEQIGRFDPSRARERLRASFSPESTRKIMVDGDVVGFVASTFGEDEVTLDHLYLLPAFQGQGIGSSVVRDLFAIVDELGLPVKVGALKESASNEFYRRHGFIPESEGDWDNHYVRVPSAA